MNNMEDTYDACVIGAGASGLVAASVLARRGFRTILIEQNKKSGRKLYATGNGRCNLANAVLSDSKYYEDPFACAVVTEESVRELHRFLSLIGITLTNRDGYLYPASMQASSVVWALTDAARLAGAEFLYDTEITAILREEPDAGAEGYLLHTAGGRSIRVSRLVLSMGSPAAEQLGAAKKPTLYRLLMDLGLPYREFQPALCPLEAEDASPEVLLCSVSAADQKALAGVRCHARLSLGSEAEEGELQLTEYGISGIVTFNLSTIAEIGDRITVDLLPDLSEREILRILRNQSGKRRLFAALNGLLHEKLCEYFLKGLFGEEGRKRALEGCTEEELTFLCHSLKHWELTITGKRGEQGQACSGGVSTEILDPATMTVTGEKRYPHLAITGELVDVVGRCGGYNLMFALISGRKAGLSV